MATFTIEIADGDVERVLTAICSNYGWQEEVDNPGFNADMPVDDTNKIKIANPETGPQFANRMVRKFANPETGPQFANRMVRKFLSDHVVSHERRKAKEQAVQALNSSISISDPEL